ncbi:MAG: hypothetical protein ACI4RA_08655 [Kiritimatiellia bacterium]
MRGDGQRDLAAKSREVRAWMADPHRFFKAFSRTARRFQHTHPSPRYRAMTLVGGAAEFLSRRPLRVHLLGQTTPVRSWPEVLAAVVRRIVVVQPDLVRALDAQGLIPWFVKRNAADDVVTAFCAGAVTLKLASQQAAFEATQWIALMADVKLNEVVVQVDPFTDEEWRVRERQLQTKREEQSRVLREIDLARRRYAETHADETATTADIPEATW